MSDDGKWKNLDTEQVVLFSEGLCPWDTTNSHPLKCVERGGEVVAYSYCILVDALVRSAKGKLEIIAAETALANKWRIAV